MGVYVDEIHKWPSKIKCFAGGSCHLVADTPEELHAMARRLRLRPDWFQDKKIPHYDLTVPKRAEALRLGAEEDFGLRDYLKRKR